MTDFDHYPDKGCKESPSCLNCPLELCIYDAPSQSSVQKAKSQLRDQEKIRDFNEALKTMGRLAAARFVAAKHKITERTVHRILQRANRGVRT